jgi:hypothetical protein
LKYEEETVIETKKLNYGVMFFMWMTTLNLYSLVFLWHVYLVSSGIFLALKIQWKVF